jgi:trypsin-like peptidase/effector-associated domain 1 (EAD1)-containing protein
MPMPGVDFGEFHAGLVEAFDQGELARLLRMRMDVGLAKIVSPGSFDDVAFLLLEWLERQGREAEFARAAYVERPNNAKLRRVYEKYGMAPAVSVQASGQPVSLTRATTAALEATVKPRLKTVEIAVWRQHMANVEGQVCRIEFNNNAIGTGFLVGPDLVLTNYHVLERPLKGQLPAEQVACRFDYKVLSDGSRSEGTVARLRQDDWKVDACPYSKAEAEGTPDREAPTSDELDFALVRLARPVGSEPVEKNAGPGAPKRGWVAVPPVQPAITKGMPLMIAQHPDGSPMKLAFDTDSVIGMSGADRRVRYATNTEPGSSGSPCFDIDWSLVALHHLGDPAWIKVPPQFNQGIPIGLIAQRLAAKMEFEAP